MSSFRRTRREALLAGSLWVVFAIWVISVSYHLGYDRQELSLTLGLPTWVFWGVVVPWVTAVVANTILAFFVLADDE